MASRRGRRSRRRKKSNPVPFIVAIVVVAAVGLGVYFYFNGPYTKYAAAFSNSTSAGSSEYDTTVTVEVDDEKYTASGNMKIRRDDDDNVTFLNIMTVDDGETITQFSDGKKFYVDAPDYKTSFNLGENPEPEAEMRERGEYTLTSFMSQYAELLDANRLRDLQLTQKLDQRLIQKTTAQPISSGTRYELEVSTALVERVFNTVGAYATSEENESPEFKLNDFTYTAEADAKDYMVKVIYTLDMDATIPASVTGTETETKNLKIKLTADIINPGEAVEFDLPGTDGF